MQADFLSKLYEIKPFKVVNSPQSNKCPHHQHTSSSKKQPSLNLKQNHQQLAEMAPDKQNKNAFAKITDSNLFSNLSESIDNLFSKIEKIKLEFDCHEDASERPAQKQNQMSDTKKRRTIKRRNQSGKSYHDSSNKKSSLKKTSNFHQQICSPFQCDFDERQSELILHKNHSSSNKKNLIVDLSLHKSKSLYEKQQIEGMNLTGKYLNLQAQSFPLSMREFELGKCVGSGKFGDVYICRHKPTNSILALKKIFKSTIKQYNMVGQFTKQLKIHYLLNHPSVVKLYSFFEDEYHVFLLMQYAEGGTLYEKFLDKTKKAENYQLPSQKAISQTIFQVLNSVSYLHRNNILHRDIKPENIVITHENSIKLCDFGWSAIFNNKMKKTFCGTLDYLSPEMKDRGEYSTSVDLWSIGVLTFELLAGYAPFKKQIDKMKWKGVRSGQNQIKQNKWQWNNIPFPLHLSKQAKDFITGLLQQNPDQRLSIRECLKHPFIISHNFQQLSNFNENELKNIL